jgi:hypothetical protein
LQYRFATDAIQAIRSNGSLLVISNRSRAGIAQKPQQPQKNKAKTGLMQASESPSETCLSLFAKESHE